MGSEVVQDSIVDEISRITELSASISYVLSHPTEVSESDRTILNGGRDFISAVRRQYWTNQLLITFPLADSNLACQLADRVVILYADSSAFVDKERYLDRVLGASGNVFARLTKPNSRGQFSYLECEIVDQFFDSLSWEARHMF
jgi:hypothetical protein